MANRTPTQDKALGWYCKANGLVAELSAHPVYYFRNKQTGETLTRHIEFIVKDFKEDLEQSKNLKKAKGKS